MTSCRAALEFLALDTQVNGVYRPRFKLDTRVIRVPVIPGVDPRIAYGKLADRNIKGVILEAFGVGNMPDLPKFGWLPWLRSIRKEVPSCRPRVPCPMPCPLALMTLQACTLLTPCIRGCSIRERCARPSAGPEPAQALDLWVQCSSRLCCAQGVKVYLSSQCASGDLQPELYRAGSAALDMGVEGGPQMTPEVLLLAPPAIAQVHGMSCSLSAGGLEPRCLSLRCSAARIA